MPGDTVGVAEPSNHSKQLKIYPNSESIEPELPRQAPTNGKVISSSPLQYRNAPSPMLVTLSGIVTRVRLVQLENALPPIPFTPLSIATLVNPPQSANASPPIIVTLLGIVTLVSLLHPENAFVPIPRAPSKTNEPEIMLVVSITQPSTNLQPGMVVVSNSAALHPSNTEESTTESPFGSLMFFRLRQFLNADPPMRVTLFGIVILVRALQPENVPSQIILTPLGIVTLVSPLQPENAENSMLVTLSGIVTFVSPLQPENARIPMLVTPLGIVTLVSLSQPSNADREMCLTG